METVYEGSWEEVAAHGAELAGRYVRVTVQDAPEEVAKRARLERFRRSAEKVVEIGKSLPDFPDRRFTNNDYYPDGP